MLSLAASYALTRHLPKNGGHHRRGSRSFFGGLTLILHNNTFVKMKQTILYGLFQGI